MSYLALKNYVLLSYEFITEGPSGALVVDESSLLEKPVSSEEMVKYKNGIFIKTKRSNIIVKDPTKELVDFLKKYNSFIFVVKNDKGQVKEMFDDTASVKKRIAG